MTLAVLYAALQAAGWSIFWVVTVLGAVIATFGIVIFLIGMIFGGRD